MYLGMDMGGTATRWVLRAQGAETRGTVAGASGLIEDPATRAGFVAALQAVRAALPGDPASVVLGATGTGMDPGPEIHALVAQTLGAARVRVMNDMVLAWHAAFAQGGGHLVLAGTGSVGLGYRGDRPVLVGGRGWRIDDAGGGVWIARRALDHLWRCIDRDGDTRGVPLLAQALSRAMGGDDWETTRRFVYGGDRGQMGTLARAVAGAARAGCDWSAALMHDAGRELGRLAQALHSRCGPAPLAATGGVLDLHPGIRAGLEATAPGPVDYPFIDAARRAAELADPGEVG
jgi:glucosamine kinase